MRTILMYVMLMCCSATIAQTAVVADLAAKVEETSQEMYVEDPVLQDPVSLNAALVWSNDKKQLAVVMKVRVLEGWHIYAYVPDSQPYLTAELKLSAPDGVTPIGEQEKPGAYPSADGVYVYEGNLVFVHYFSVDKPVKEKQIETGLYYQTCDLKQCLPPVTKTRKLTI